MNHNAKEQIDQEIQTLTMNYGHHLMADTETKNASWDSKSHTLEENKTQNVSMVRN